MQLTVIHIYTEAEIRFVILNVNNWEVWRNIFFKLI